MNDHKDLSPPLEASDPSADAAQRRTRTTDEAMQARIPSNSPAAGVPSWTVRYCWAVLGALIFIHSLSVFILLKTESSGNKNLSYAVLGGLFSQPLLFSLWAAFAPQRFYVRFLWCLPLCALISFFESIKILMQDSSKSVHLVFMIINVAIFFATMPLFQLVRHFMGWRLIQISFTRTESDYRSYQFGIKHLILLMTVTGLVFGLFRSLVEMGVSESFFTASKTLRIFFELFLMVAPLVFIYWLALVKFEKWILSLFFSLISLIVLEIAIFNIIPKMDGNRMRQVILFLQIGAGLSVLISTLVIRWCGFRMVRQK